jgi:hypothetical protein
MIKIELLYFTVAKYLCVNCSTEKKCQAVEIWADAFRAVDPDSFQPGFRQNIAGFRQISVHFFFGVYVYIPKLISSKKG